MMAVPVLSQLSLFGASVLLGLAFGAAYEICRVPRLFVRVHPVLVFAADILYAFFASGVLFIFTFIRNDGQLRLYVLLAVFLGLLFYGLTLGQVVRAVCLKIKSQGRRKKEKG